MDNVKMQIIILDYTVGRVIKFNIRNDEKVNEFNYDSDAFIEKLGEKYGFKGNDVYWMSSISGEIPVQEENII